MIRITVKPSPFKQAEAYLVETMFYDEWAPSGESSISKLSSTFIPIWDNAENDLELDLRELLSRKRKRREASTSSSDNLPRYVRVKTFDRRIIYKL